MTNQEMEQLIKLVYEQIKPAWAMIGYRPECTIENLKAMEDVINRVYPEGHEPLAITTFIPFGIHLGEVLIKYIPGAKWKVEGVDDPREWIIECSVEGKEGTFQAKPIMRISKFWFDRTDTIFGWAEMIRDMLQGSLIMDTNGQWVDRGKGVAIRGFAVQKEDEIGLKRVKKQMSKEQTNTSLNEFLKQKRDL